MTKTLVPKAQITLLMDETGRGYAFIPPFLLEMAWQMHGFALKAREATRPREERDAQR